jgi:hypothetical protein
MGFWVIFRLFVDFEGLMHILVLLTFTVVPSSSG